MSSLLSYSPKLTEGLQPIEATPEAALSLGEQPVDRLADLVGRKLDGLIEVNVALRDTARGVAEQSRNVLISTES